MSHDEWITSPSGLLVPPGTVPRESRPVLERMTSAVTQRLARAVAPIYIDRGNRAPELIGSGVLIRVGEMTFVASAAHVADHGREEPLLFGRHDEVRPLYAYCISSSRGPDGKRESDTLDVAAWVLDPAETRCLSPADSIPASALDLPPFIERDDRREFFYINGYPISRQRGAFLGRELNGHLLAFLTHQTPSEGYASAGRDPALSILVQYDKRAIGRGDLPITGPDLYGVSGGAVWRLSGGRASVERPVLAGIAIEWRHRTVPKAIIATRMAVWAGLIADRFPHLAPELGFLPCPGTVIDKVT